MMSNDFYYGKLSLPNASKDFMKVNPQLGNGQVKRASASSARAMNTHEARFAMKLEADKREGLIDDWKFEAIRLRLADRTTYTPDFVVILPPYFTDISGKGNGFPIRFIEVKGFRRDDAMVKFKVARELYTWAEFEMWTLTKNAWKRVM